MKDADWKVLMHALSLQAQAVPFSAGLDQRTREAITDHMIGVADLIEAYPVPQFVKALSEALTKLQSEMNAEGDGIAFLRETSRTQAETIARLERALREATKLTRFVIENRGCICNTPGHRCGTNLMLADVAKIEEHLA